MFIDVHCHVDRYKGNLEQALEQIKRHRIFTISNSMDLPSYERNAEIAANSDFILPVFGIHPWNAFEYRGRLRDLDRFIAESPLIGEIGLDAYFVKDASRYPAQREVFEYFLQAAGSQKKIVIVHTKGAESEVLLLLKRYKIERVIIHWYSGPRHIFRAMAGQGFYFTVGVEVLHSRHIQDIAKSLPAELLLTETDNPGGSESIRGTAGTPLVIRDVIKKIAEIRGTSDRTIMTTVQNNLVRLGGKDPWLANTPLKTSID